jgi:glycyl-tRNA synthetase beta chain
VLVPRFVLEIGTEEIPPRYFPVALPSLAEQGRAMLERARLSHEGVKVYGTPRRLALIVEELAALQAAAVREERGPATKVAFDAEGKPTKAAEGFARRWGLTPEKLERRRTDQGEYVFAVIQEPELPAAQALAPLLPGLITGIPFPKTMRWGTGNLRFGRPIRWLLALVDDQVVEFELGGIQSGRLTRGHPVLAEGMYEVGCAADYEKVLEEHKVIANSEERRDLTCRYVDLAAAEAADGAEAVRGGLLEETTFLVEYPTAAVGRFGKAFLKLPRSVLVAEMQHVQYYFPLEDGNGSLLPMFIAVRDGDDADLEQVVAGWESVLRAKLIDARFFFERDLEIPLADRVEALRGVVFQEKLGTMHEKMERLRVIAADLADQVGLDEHSRSAFERAALLCKADLTTEMVAELSDLQGRMGQEYALASGEAWDVAEAIGEHYQPRSAGEDAPKSELGRLLAVGDKMDIICACAAVGIMPTGSADPYGLRREASGLVKIVTESGLRVSAGRLARVALEALERQMALAARVEGVVGSVMELLRQRLDTQLRDEGEVRYDLVNAALAVGFDDLRMASARAHLLSLLAAHAEFLPTVVACTRPINISKDFAGAEVDPSLFQEEAERALWDAYQKALKKAESASLIELFGVFAGMRETIDRFFDEVLVMHEDERMRRNRLALCWHINHDLFRRLADFSLIVQA